MTSPKRWWGVRHVRWLLYIIGTMTLEDRYQVELDAIWRGDA